jgi:hypothetical protein
LESETVELGGVVQTIKVAHFRLSYSRQMFVVAYPRETQEMVLDAHSKVNSKNEIGKWPLEYIIPTNNNKTDKTFDPHNTRQAIAKDLGWSTGKVAMGDYF